MVRLTIFRIRDRASLVSAAEGIIFKNPDSSGQYCHLKFPAITRDSLFAGRPVLKDPSDGDIIGPGAPGQILTYVLNFTRS
jgi:hypothetical protein